MMFIKNDIVSLRVAEPNDADLIYRWENDMDIWRDSETRVPYSMRQIEQFLLNNNDLVSENQLRLMIENSNGDAVGCIDLYDYDEFNSRAGIGILVDKAHRGKGYARQAIELLLEYCFKILMLNQIYVLILSTNAESAKLFESIGFVKCGQRKQWYKTENGFADQIEYQYINRHQNV